MPVSLDVADFLLNTGAIPVVDVRSPAEFRRGHMPGAISIPLFNDQERATVGSLYVQAGRDQAILKGLDLILPKIRFILQALTSDVPGKKLLMYCWRDGLRSANMRVLCEQAGYQVQTLTGGYKAYRRYIRQQLGEDAPVVVLGGFTGSGKTEILQGLTRKGEQVIDLEGLASHKGSAFGGIGLPEQPTNEQFENNLFDLWRKLDKSRLIWLEDESRMIGRVTLPDPVIQKIQTGPLIILEVPKEKRIQRLVEEYSGTEDALLVSAILKIEERLGKPRTLQALDSVDTRDYAAVAENVLIYYDKAYSFSIGRRTAQPRHLFTTDGLDPESVTSQLLAFADKHLRNGSDLPRL